MRAQEERNKRATENPEGDSIEGHKTDEREPMAMKRDTV